MITLQLAVRVPSFAYKMKGSKRIFTMFQRNHLREIINFIIQLHFLKKMKFQTTIFSLVSSTSIRENRSLDVEDPTQARRHSQMEAWMEHYNPSFDKRDLYYGCHCFTTSDRPMSDMGKGRPVDEIDSVCLKYKQCLKCARNEFSDSCMNEFVFYGVAMNGNQPQCTDEAGTCGRKLCECDKEFAKTVVDEVKNNFSIKFKKLIFLQKII